MNNILKKACMLCLCVFLFACSGGNSSDNRESTNNVLQNETPAATNNATPNETSESTNNAVANTPAAPSLTLSETELRLDVNFSANITASITPESADQSVDWSSSDKRILTISETGYLRAFRTGKANITARSVAYPNLAKSLDVDVKGELVRIKNHIHESLSTDWQSDYTRILEYFSTLLPIYQSYFSKLDIYAWNDQVTDPYPGIGGGAYVSGHADQVNLVMEIPNNEFAYDSTHRFSVIAQEYFHVYQKSISNNMNFNGKWLIEGAAATVESLFIQQDKNKNYFLEAQTNINDLVMSTPNIFESYQSNSQEINYGTSVFMVLVLAKELQANGYSEAIAFRKIFRDFMFEKPTFENWKTVFETVFEMTLETFYSNIQNYEKDLNTVLPSETLTLEDIFIDE